MTTLPAIFLALLALCLAALLAVLFHKQRAAFSQIKAEEADIVAEERRMFGFLHDLGEAISREDSLSVMHRLIAEGAMRVEESLGGAVYLLDPAGRELVPRYISEQMPPLIPVPADLADPASAPALLSHLRLKAVGAESDLLGRVFTSQKAELIGDLSAAGIAGAALASQSGIQVMIGPLTSGNRRLGVLAVAANANRKPFSQNDFEVFNSLAEQSAFALANAMAHQEAQEKKRIEAELRSAGEIQKILLPEKDPQLPGFIVAGKNIPARVLSGDYYDYIPLDGDRFGAVIADVSGKGVAAALITAMCRSVLRSNASASAPPSAVLAAVNRLMYPDIREDMFVSMIYLVLDQARGEVSLARAGHTYPLLWRKAAAAVESIKSGGLAVGIDRGEVFSRVTKDTAFHMEPGDCLLLYTDGVDEAMNPQGDEFGEQRVVDALNRLAPQGARAVVDGLIAEVNAFTGGRRSHDDITLIALQKAA